MNGTERPAGTDANCASLNDALKGWEGDSLSSVGKRPDIYAWAQYQAKSVSWRSFAVITENLSDQLPSP